MSRNLSRITLALVACLIGAAFVYGQNFQKGPPGGGGADNFYAPHAGGGTVALDPWGDEAHARNKLNQEEHDLAQQAEEIARRLGAAENTGDRDQLRTELRELLGKQFDIQRQRREQEIAQIEERVRKLRDQLKKRSDNRQKIVDNRIDQILNDADGLGWNGPDGGGGGGFGGFSVFGGGGPAPRATVVGPGGRGIAPVPIPPGHPTAPRAGRAPAPGAPAVPPSAQPGAAPAPARQP
jgi:hypothetical protein